MASAFKSFRRFVVALLIVPHVSALFVLALIIATLDFVERLSVRILVCFESSLAMTFPDLDLSGQLSRNDPI
jgi:hypothetical protein